MDKKREDSQGPPAADVATREKMLENRTAWMKAHEFAVAERDAAIADREELVRLREAELEARREADAARAERERLLVQIREVNERLVLASLQSQQSAEDANAARVAADDNADRFRSLILTLSAVVWRATADGRIEVDREAWRRLTGAHPAESDWGWLEAVHPLDRARVRDTWQAAVAAVNSYACRHRIRSRAGGYAWVMARAVPITRSGIVREWIGILTDISDRVRVEEARDQFIGILGHDLRNPLASIVASTGLLGSLPEPHARTVARVVRSAHRIEALVRDLLDFSHGRFGGGIPIAPRPCDLRLICEEGVEEIKQVYATRTIRFSGTGDLRGEWDPDRIEQVVSNLLGNAVVHGEDPIVVTSHGEDEVVVTSVHNEGAPIPDSLMPTLFEPFTKATEDMQDRPDSRQGLGLGLYIAHEIVRAHGGTLVVSSVVYAGTTFMFTLPRRVPRRARTTTGEEAVVI
jgi:PAS domain S-box-containing protein